MPQHYTLAQAAQKIGMTKGRLKQMAQDGSIKTKKKESPVTAAGYYYLISQSEVDRLQRDRSGVGRPRIGDLKKS